MKQEKSIPNEIQMIRSFHKFINESDKVELKPRIKDKRKPDAAFNYYPRAEIIICDDVIGAKNESKRSN